MHDWTNEQILNIEKRMWSDKWKEDAFNLVGGGSKSACRCDLKNERMIEIIRWTWTHDVQHPRRQPTGGWRHRLHMAKIWLK